MAMCTRSTPNTRAKIFTPPSTSSGCSRRVRWSLVMYGSHSLALTITVSTLPRPELIFTWVGKVAPPMPTMPAFFTISQICSTVRLSGSLGARREGQGVSVKSFSITTLITGTPEKWIRGSTAATVPDTLAWTGAETKAGASPTICPTVT